MDESGANSRMAPLYGRALGGERVINAVPFNRGHRLTMLSAISFEKIEAALYGEWAADGEIFLNFITRILGSFYQALQSPSYWRLFILRL